MVKLSMSDVAYNKLKEQRDGIDFYDLYDHVCMELEFNEEQKTKNISQFYTNLTFDGRLIFLKENTWGLREYHSFDKVHIDMNDIYDDKVIITDDGALSIEDQSIDEDEEV